MYTSINDTSEVLLIYRFIGGHMISTCTLFFMVSMTQHFKFVLSHYMNVLLILSIYDITVVVKINFFSVSVSVYTSDNTNSNNNMYLKSTLD